MVIMISFIGQVRYTHQSDLANKVAAGNWHRINVHTIMYDKNISKGISIIERTSFPH